MAKLVAVDAGHGLHTAGKRTPDGEREWTFNNKVVLSLIDELHKLGIKTIRLDDPTGKRDVPLRERTNKANKAKADVLVSVHHNAFKGVWGGHTGTEVYSYPNSKKGAELAKKLQPELAKAYGLKDRGAKTANFHMLRESNMPAILTEGGYMDSEIDIKKMRDDKVLDRAGRTSARVVAEWLGVKKAEPIKADKPVSKPKSTSKGEYTGNSIVDYLNHNKIDSSFANRKKLAREYLGITNYSGTAKQNTDLLNAMRSGVKNKIQPKSGSSKSISQMADEIEAGKHGNGHENRRKSLGINKSEYERVRAEVNRRAGVSGGSGKSIKQMADEVIAGKHGNGHAQRRKSLGVDNATYQKVRAEVNKRA